MPFMRCAMCLHELRVNPMFHRHGLRHHASSALNGYPGPVPASVRTEAGCCRIDISLRVCRPSPLSLSHLFTLSTNQFGLLYCNLKMNHKSGIRTPQFEVSNSKL